MSLVSIKRSEKVRNKNKIIQSSRNYEYNLRAECKLIFFIYSTLEIGYEINEVLDDCELERIVDTVDECRHAKLELGVRLLRPLHILDPRASKWFPAGCFYFHTKSDIWFNTVVDPSKTTMERFKPAAGICRIQNHTMTSFLFKSQSKLLK